MLLNINKDLYVIKENISDKEVYSTKIVDSLPDDWNEYNYKYINGELVRAELIPVKGLDDFKADKLAELETFIQGKRSQGIEWNDQVWSIDEERTLWFKLDEECENNLVQTSIFADSLLANGGITWYTRNGEQGSILITTKDQWLLFMGVLATKIAEIKNKYYLLKTQINNAQSKEELDNIVFDESEEAIESEE